MLRKEGAHGEVDFSASSRLPTVHSGSEGTGVTAEVSAKVQPASTG